jgi:UDP-perosamine 4-acetyltransferase
MSSPVIVIGAGGHAKVLVDALLLSGVRILGLLDRDPAMAGRDVLGVPVLGGEDKLSLHAPGQTLLVNAVGSVDSMQARKTVYDRLCGQGYGFAPVVHPQAVVSKFAVIQPGAQILAGAVVGPGAVIGENAIINTRASVDHDCRIGAHVHVAPGATLSGGVVVGESSHVGTGASVIQGIRIGRGCLVAAGAVVVRDVPDGAKVWGTPAREWGA